MPQGFQYLLRGLRMLKQEGIRRYVIGPLLINIVLFASLITFATQQFVFWTDYLLQKIPPWLSFLEFIIMVIFSFTMLVNIIGAPFNALLAERVAEQCTGVAPVSAVEDWKGMLASVPRSLAREFARLAYTLPLALLIWLVTLIPAVNVLAPALWFLWGAWMMSIQYTDYAADNNRTGFADLRQTLSNNRTLTMGFGAGVTLLTMVPLLNMIIMPAAVCGATLLWCERLESQCLPTTQNKSG